MNSRNRHRYIRLFAGFVLWMAACFCPGTVSAAGNGTCEADSQALHGADQTPAGTVKATQGSTAKATQGNAAGSAAEDTPGSAAGSATKVVGDSRFSIAGFDADDTVKEDPTQKRPLTHRIGAEFGFTPVSRQRIHAGPTEERDELEEIFSGIR